MKKLNMVLTTLVVLAILLQSTGLVSYAQISDQTDDSKINIVMDDLCVGIAETHDNVNRVIYGTSAQGRDLVGYVITNPNQSDSNACKIKVSGKVNVRNGAGTSYKIVASLKNGTAITRVAKGVKKANGYIWDKISFGKNQFGYVATDYIRQVGVSAKTLFMDFAVHGFEDEYYRDGQALVNEAYAIITYFADHPSALQNYRLVIVPCANPYGTYAGNNNSRSGKNAFGRCTSEHIDINRDFGAFKAVETRKLRDFIKSSKPDIYLNMHGWLDETIGDKGINSIVSKHLGLSQSINNYPTQDGYAVNWVHNNMHIPSALVEYRSSAAVSVSKDIAMIKSLVVANITENTTTSSSSSGFAKPIVWKNGSTAEKVYKISDFTAKSATVKAKTKAVCYGKFGNAYVIVYSGNKTGFVRYSGGVKNPPASFKTYKNGSTSEKVYADTGKKTAVGSLNPQETCKCLAKIGGMYLVVYNVSGTKKQKCGFVTYNGVK